MQVSGITCTRILEFDSAHRVMNHESKCANLHGHRYRVEVTAAGILDKIGRVIDFSVLKSKLGTWLDDNWDHTSILYDRDLDLVRSLRLLAKNKEPYVAPFNPTAENMAEYLLNVVSPSLFQELGIIVTRIKIWETPNCFAEASLEAK